MQLAFRLDGVSKRYPHFALEDLSLSLEPGRIMGFIGPNGAGKSTTIRLLMGLIAADAGRIDVLGHRLPQGIRESHRDIGFASEDMTLYPAATLAWHIDFVRRAFGQWDAAYADELLDRFDLRSGQRIKGMSHGQRVKSCLLLALARRPRLLLLDEPTTGLDPVARAEVLESLADVLLDEDRTVLFSSHNTTDIERLCDQITFVDRGRLVSVDDKESFIENWRRLRFEAPSDIDFAGIDALVSTSRDGRFGDVVLNRDDPDTLRRIADGGGNVIATERMNLEEIFVAAVRSSRRKEAA